MKHQLMNFYFNAIQMHKCCLFHGSRIKYSSRKEKVLNILTQSNVNGKDFIFNPDDDFFCLPLL